MTQIDSARAVHSIVCALPDPAALRGTATAGAGALKRLGELIDQALAHSRASAEHRGDLEFGAAVSFLNSGAALNFTRFLQHFATGESGLPIRIGVHMGSLGGADEHPEQRGPVRLARQFALFAPTGKACASPLFHNFVTQFDHRCKSMLYLMPPVLDPQGRSVQLYEVRFDGLPALDEAIYAATDVAPLLDPIALDAEDEARLAFLQKVERLLAEEIGPLASRIVRKAAVNAKTRASFFQIIAETLPETTERAEFFRALDRL